MAEDYPKVAGSSVGLIEAKIAIDKRDYMELLKVKDFC